jgi:hypothetical protein
MRRLAVIALAALAVTAHASEQTSAAPRAAPRPAVRGGGGRGGAPAYAPGARAYGPARVTGPVAPAPAPRAAVAPDPAPYPSPRVRPIPAPYPASSGRPRYAPAPGYGTPRHGGYVVGYDPFVPFVAPFWFGWGWGWGYYPLYPRPEPGMIPEGEPQADPNRIATRLSVHGAAQDHGAVGGIAFGIDGRRLGFQAAVDAISLDTLTGGGAGFGHSSALGWGTMHLTWSLVSEAAYRVRLEAGGSMLSFPNAASLAGRPYAGSVVFGPNLGVSGHVGLVGPLGIEGHARISPTPVTISDVAGALALRGGPLAITGGWRWIDVAGNGTDAPQLHFSGPEIGLSFLF